jgi:hypothetical protein
MRALLLVATCSLFFQEVHSDELVRVILVSRHGLKNQYREGMEYAGVNFSDYSPGFHWPEFGVPSGEMTRHGAELIELMGRYVHTLYGGVLGKATPEAAKGPGCGLPIAIFADPTCRRDIESARFFVKGLSPTCSAAALNNTVFQGVLKV